MKKIVLVSFLLMLLPLQAMALQSMSDAQMAAVFGQSGVSISIDDVKIFQNVESLVYTDSDGTSGPGSGGGIGVGSLTMKVEINAIVGLSGGLPVSRSGSRPVQFDYSTATGFSFSNARVAGDPEFTYRPLTIDAGACPILGAADGKRGVIIGLPTLEIYQTALSLDINTYLADAAHTPTGLSYGNIYIGKMTMAILDGVVEIAPH